MKECYFTQYTCTNYIQSVSTTCDEPIKKAYDQKTKWDPTWAYILRLTY